MLPLAAVPVAGCNRPPPAPPFKPVVDAGADVYAACNHCHSDYMVAIKRPN